MFTRIIYQVNLDILNISNKKSRNIKKNIKKHAKIKYIN